MTIFGTTGDDMLTGTVGDDVINGLEGVDRLAYNASFGDVRVFYSSNGLVVNARRASEGVDVARNVEWFDFSDGVELQLTSDPAGVLMTVAVDHDDAYNWFKVRTKFDDNGRLQSRLEEFDDGTARMSVNDYNANGRLAQVTEIDGPNGMTGNRPWDTRVSTFDDDGRIESRVTTYDSGRFLTQHFEFDASGQLTSRIEYDGSLDAQGELVAGSGIQPWTTREATFDDQRRLDSMVTRYDDGTARTDVRTFDLFTGRMTERTVYDGEFVDGPNGETLVNDAAGWREQAFTLDDLGRTQNIVTTFDDGRQLTKTFVRLDGELAYRVDYDGVYDEDTETYVNDGLNWDTNVFFYSDGVLSSSTLTVDNRDTIVTEFDVFGVSKRTITDVSDTRSWETKTHTYDANGAKTTTLEMDNGDVIVL